MEPNSPARKFAGLPPMVVGPADVGRLIRELEAVDDHLLQQQLQHQEAKLAKTSKLLDELISVNQVNLLVAGDRARLKEFLTAVKQRAPMMHMSFGTDPSPVFTEKLMSWLRENIHPLLLLTVGLQPDIGAGCRLRTTNKYFDFSLSQRFDQNREQFLTALHATAADAQEAA